jgi:hypothetical protein
MTRVLLVLCAGAVVLAAPLSAHHSFAAYYFEEQSVTITEVVEFDYRSPHAWLHVAAPDPSGQMRRYAAEWANPNRLGQQGVTRETLRPGDRVIVTGSPGRTASEFKLHLKGITRPADGWQWRGGRNRR